MSGQVVWQRVIEGVVMISDDPPEVTVVEDVGEFLDALPDIND
ncbi:MAG: hypothetical protein ABR549_15645 [Mycobacteriales bacterium]